MQLIALGLIMLATAFVIYKIVEKNDSLGYEDALTIIFIGYGMRILIWGGAVLIALGLILHLSDFTINF